jgi:Protein of unknown function (DUF4240)
MDRDQFWSMIEAARQASGGDVQQQAAALKAELRRLPLAEVVGFQQNLEDLQAESFSVQLWGAAEAIVDQVSEDHFFGFRGWLIAKAGEPRRRPLPPPTRWPTFLSCTLAKGCCRGVRRCGSSQSKSTRSEPVASCLQSWACTPS